MRASSIGYSIKQGIKNIRRNKMFSLASIGTIMACLFLFGVFYFVLANVQYMMKMAETSVGITVFFDEGIGEAKIKDIGTEIKTRKEISSMNYISAEEAWKKFQKEMYKDDKDLTEAFQGDNPLADSASYEIYLNDVSKQDNLVKFIEKIDGVRKVNSSEVTAKGLSSFNILVGYVSATIIIILISVAVFLISTTITMGISVRKDEIAIMKLIGATDFFIRAPFIVEGILIGFLGSLFPLVVLYFIYNKIIAYITVKYKFNVLSNFLTFLDVKDIFATLIPISILMGIGIGFFGSILTVRKHLRV
ncbi:permease-like cell division protein FtsX [Anaeromicropila herbilytica]|uniref:Cell division protein FtsX n=1 Tax=Anaeromicropila herbilytica TaxID=2785025 RepID=A0A7R7EPI9_9FIRM|nr:permease-like cell division protein FtsX [Anaeromicropila herbilytica]BCN32649.1 cell division protein FtsX [Anaeromicropila herbilytica]